MHIVSDKSMQRRGWKYTDMGGSYIGWPDDRTWSVNRKHIDGPLMYHSDGGLHWLTLRERVFLKLGLTTLDAIDKQYSGGRRISR